MTSKVKLAITILTIAQVRTNAKSNTIFIVRTWTVMSTFWNMPSTGITFLERCVGNYRTSQSPLSCYCQSYTKCILHVSRVASIVMTKVFSLLNIHMERHKIITLVRRMINIPSLKSLSMWEKGQLIWCFIRKGSFIIFVSNEMVTWFSSNKYSPYHYKLLKIRFLDEATQMWIFCDWK